MREYSTLAAVDLGSNSFHLQVARVVDKQLYPLDSLKEMIRLAGGITADKKLDESSQERALDCLKRFGERLRGFPTHAVRVVGTNSLRVAKNAAAFLRKAEGALGFPIEIIAGHEEARLIYLGVAHALPASDNNRLVIDIGGGSTEFIIGHQLNPYKLESLYMGCVSHSLHHFSDGKLTKSNMKRAELAAQTEIQSIKADFSSRHWQEALLGRSYNDDMREVSVKQFMQRYLIDTAQANRIELLASELGKQLLSDFSDEEKVEDALQLLSWAARLHEVGISVAHSSYHKHSSYILGNADMPGFSNMEQAQLSELVLSHQGSLTKVSEFLTNPIDWDFRIISA